MRKAIITTAVVLAFVLPWALVLLLRPAEPVPEWCEVPYRIDHEGAPAGAIDATIRTRFKADGSGSSTPDRHRHGTRSPLSPASRIRYHRRRRRFHAQHHAQRTYSGRRHRTARAGGADRVFASARGQ